MTDLPHGEPIWIRCEGSGTKPGKLVRGIPPVGMCAMCGYWHPLESHQMPEHVRDDIIARVHRGDFE